MRCIVTRTSDGTLPVGGASYLSTFIDHILPAHRAKLMRLQPKQRVNVTFCPLRDDGHGYEVEVYRCPGR